MTALTPQELVQHIGRPVGTSAWILVDQARIDAFAEATGDRQFIHVDPAAAALTPFGTTVAHGFLTLSLLSQMAASLDGPRIAGARMALNYGSDRVRFLAPVRSGSRVRGHFVLTALDEKQPGRWQQHSRCTVEIEHEQTPALIADWITQYFL